MSSHIAVVSANIDNFDSYPLYEKQTIDCDFFYITDKEFPLRKNSLSPRLQARIIKLFLWQFAPEYTYYLWVDSSCRLANKNSVSWFIEKLGDADIAVFKHPHRNTIQEEADYLKKRLDMGCPYITPRYENELIDEQLAEISLNKEFVDKDLYASTAFIYKYSEEIKRTMKEWWYHTSRYHSIDQLSLPYVLWNSSLKVNVIPDNYLKCESLEYIRNKK